MKKVLKPGAKPELVITCNHCACEFSSDEYNEKKLAGRDEVQITDKCPECKRKVTYTDQI